jgi:hypothetical protein
MYTIIFSLRKFICNHLHVELAHILNRARRFLNLKKCVGTKTAKLFEREEWGSNPLPKHSPIFVKRIQTRTRDSLKKEKKKNHTTLVYYT